ncbi:hypothetical protein [Actinomadura welshii]|uniref:hypothetical protein n=1 Tax=Actinomadura welshii TaxID=3103817 RepID=UPI0003AD7151|nr:hypothetical protein [Actinomadura madurae]
MELDWGFFRRLYEGLFDHHDDVAGREGYLGGQQRTVAAHLADLAPLRRRELIPASGYKGDDEQLWRIMKLYGLSRVGDYLIELFCPEGEPPPGFGPTGFRRLDFDGRAVHTR